MGGHLLVALDLFLGVARDALRHGRPFPPRVDGLLGEVDAVFQHAVDRLLHGPPRIRISRRDGRRKP